MGIHILKGLIAISPIGVSVFIGISLSHLLSIHKWLKETYPSIVAKAKTEVAQICWGDETAVSSVEHYARGYAPKNKTPVMVLSQAKRERINLISVITNQGTVRFMLYRNNLSAEVLIRFLERLTTEAPHKVFLILHNLRVHHIRKVKAWLTDFNAYPIRYAA